MATQQHLFAARVEEPVARFNDHRAAALALEDRAKATGVSALTDAEALQLLIATASPAAPAAAAASSLLDRFGCLTRVLAGELPALRQIVDDQAALSLHLAFDLARRVAETELPARELLTSTLAVTKYLTLNMSHLETEEFRVLHLDTRNQLIAEEVMWRGTVAHCPVYPRDIIKRCLERNSAAILIAHNHPSGLPEPSNADIQTTREIAAAAKVFSIHLHDHFVVGRASVVSFRERGLL